MTYWGNGGRTTVRRTALIALLLSSAGALAGCMTEGPSANTFGFQSPDQLAALESVQPQTDVPAEGSEAVTALPEETAAEPPPVDSSETGIAAISAAPVVPDAPTKPEPVPAQTEVAAAEPAERPSPVSAFTAPAATPAGRSLYESLYTEAAARTPIRNADAQREARVVITRTDGAGKPQKDAALPGVDPDSLFEIGQRASADSEELLEDIGSSYQVASLSGMARLAPSGFLVQRDDIVTNCFGSELVTMLRQIERKFGKKVIVTSGFRSPSHNKRVNGAKASMHMACKAADLHVPGTDGKQVAAFVRALPGRGGVGTYCHTAAIHVDVGPKRDWNWGCRRRQS